MWDIGTCTLILYNILYCTYSYTVWYNACINTVSYDLHKINYYVHNANTIHYIIIWHYTILLYAYICIDRIHMMNRLPIFSSTRVGADWYGEGEIGERIP